MNIEKEIIFKKRINTLLNKILTFVGLFLKNCESAEIQEKIYNFIYFHPIYKKKDIINTFTNLILNAGNCFTNKIIEIQENTQIKQKRKKELNKINTFLSDKNTKLILEDQNEDKNIKNLPSLPQLENKNEIPNNNERALDNNDNKEDVILIEDSKDIENNKFISKKTKFPSKNDDNKSKFYFFNCYICKGKFDLNNIHKFYGNLCKKCGDYNYSFRELKIDLTGRIAIVTGGRVKIGYYIATKLLSFGCKVLITSRFPKDTILKYKQNQEYEKWKNNLIIYPIDFRIVESTVKFVNYIKNNFPHIDFLINNAAQTIRRTSEYYKYLLPIETKELNEEDEKKIIKADYINLQNYLIDDNRISKKEEISNSLMSLSNNKNPEYKEILPLSVFTSQLKIMKEKEQPKLMLMGEDGQPYDFSGGNSSWSYEFDEIPLEEFTEVQIINAWTPYYLCCKLKPIMMKSPFKDKYIVNVTSQEGNFINKNSFHVHTNMSKAALNMFTFTCAKYLKKDGIYMTCVDTGWISHMKELTNIMNKETNEHFENIFINVPLDELDGAMRVLHPIIEGIKNKNYLSGILLKNYSKSNWY